jgi:hypothetical protein
LAFFELDITLKWTANVKSSSGTIVINGTAKIPYVSDELEEYEIEVQLSLDDTKNQKEGQKALQQMEKDGIPAIKKLLKEFLTELLAGANLANSNESTQITVGEPKKSKKEGPMSKYEIIKELGGGAYSK